MSVSYSEPEMRSEFTIRPVSGALGAEVSGVDLTALDDAAFAGIYQAFLDHHVLFFHDQTLTPDEYLAFAGRFGSTAEYPFAKGMESHPRITEIVKEPDQTSNFGGMWHTDTTYLAVPPKATMLYAIETPEAGGDTLFANMHLAYETLSEGLRGVLDGLHGVSSSDLHGAALRGNHLKTGTMGGKASERTVHEARHPVVCIHPETGRKVLFVNPAHTVRFASMTRPESVPLLEYLYAHAIQPEFTCRFRWRPGSLAVWDNRSTWHSAINDYDGHRRVMRRITIQGDEQA